jgi:predicted FMN-binding regulatory protein PaiB
MYTPPMFKSDRAASLAFAEARGFAVACAWDGKKPIASPLPFYLTSANDGTLRAAFHVARHNPLVKLADGTTSWLLAVNGADAYVSPDWYVSPDQVPTWLYQVVHLTGPVRGRTRRADRDAQRQVRGAAVAEKALAVVQDDGRTAGSVEESDRGARDDG